MTVITREIRGGVDAIFDIVGGVARARPLANLRPFGHAAAIPGASGDFSGLLRHNQALYGLFLTRERQRLIDRAPLLADGRVRPPIDAQWPLDAVARTHVR